jgi:hypothetical protein
MEKLGMKLVRTYHMTPAELLAEPTFDDTGDELWDGDDVEYAIERDEWEQQQAGDGISDWEPRHAE